MPTQIGAGPLWRIDGPLPVPPEFGLLKGAEAPAAGIRIIPDVDSGGIERWINGVEVYPYPGGSSLDDWGGVWDACATGTSAEDKQFGDAIENPEFSSMTIYLAETCASYRTWDQTAFQNRAVTALEAVESYFVSREFMTGAKMIDNPHLADGNGEFPNGNTATSIGYGLGLLEEAISKTGELGIIHCSQLAATMAREKFAAQVRDGVIRTINGNIVIADTGYWGGATPKGHTPASGSQQWMFATGPIDVRRSEVFISPDNVVQALDRASGGATNGRPNRITYRAERYYNVAWDTAFQAAVLVDPCLSTCAGGS